MKHLKLAVLTGFITLFASGGIMAEGAATQQLSNQSFNGQRPYMSAPKQDHTYRADDAWEGATLITDVRPDEATSKNGHAQHQQMRLHMLGKRPYTERIAD